MCGIAGVLSLSGQQVGAIDRRLHVMNRLQQHRGPDGSGTWIHKRRHVGFDHRRLSIIGLSDGNQPMTDHAGNWLTFNGEIYNYIELREELGVEKFRTQSDTEVILQAYLRWGPDCVRHLRGMFAFALWDEKNQTLFCARDRFGIKPFYYTVVDGVCHFASEVKALLPFLKEIATDVEGFRDYLTFQFCLAGKTLFKGVSELLPGHTLTLRNGALDSARYWQVYYDLDQDHTEKYFEEKLEALLTESVAIHKRSDVPIGAYVSGGLDSSIVAALATQATGAGFKGFTGKFTLSQDYDESAYARDLAKERGFELHEIDMSVQDFMEHIGDVVYHLDYPVAGPGSFPQYMVSMLAGQHRKVVLGGQGADEMFGGYARYLVAYFEQCIKAAIDGTMNAGNFVVTYESIIPNLTSLRNYKSMLQEFWRDGLFDDMDKRYFRLINRTPTHGNEVRWDALSDYSAYDTFRSIFRADNVRAESYFDRMTHFDFKTLLPALLHVEDRVSMAHGLESRVPFLDHPLVEFAARIPPTVKFKGGRMKHVLRNALGKVLPGSIMARTDKMGFPVPLAEWFRDGLRDYLHDVFGTQRARSRDFIDNALILQGLDAEPRFSRKTWGLLCLELWQQRFHDRAAEFQGMMDDRSAPVARAA